MGDTVLIVDDDPALLDALPLTIQLRCPGVLVDTADSALSALDRISARDYDAIVTDLKMPGMDGLSLLRKIGELRPHTPTVVISGHGEHDLTVQALRGGAYDFIQKPIDRDYFAATLLRALQVRHLREETAAQQEELRVRADELHSRVEERTAQLRAASEAKDEFLALVSHELRTPLTVLNGGIHVLRSLPWDQDERAGQLLEDMEREGHRLNRIVEDLLVLARSEFLATDFMEPISLATLVRKVVDAERCRSGRDIRLHAEEAVPPTAGEATYIERVLLNLLSNAIKYSPEQSVIDVSVGAVNAREVEVSVTDRGVGIAESECAIVFDRFYRSPRSAATTSGTGIGLTVCKRLIEAMGGTVSAEPRPGGGLRVSFTLRPYGDDEP